MQRGKNANGEPYSRAERAKKIRPLFPSPPLPGGSEKLTVNCLVVVVKIMFKWNNNVVATNVADSSQVKSSLIINFAAKMAE